MRTARQKMLAGELYDPLDLELVAARAGLVPTAEVVDGERVWRRTAPPIR